MSRHDRVTEAIRKEVSVIVHDELKDPRVGFVTITKVELTNDFRLAKVYFSVLGSDEEHKKTKEALNSALGFIKKLVAERINLRLAPDIMFFEDRSSEYSVRIEEVLNEIKELTGEDTDHGKTENRGKRKEVRIEPRKGNRKHKKK